MSAYINQVYFNIYVQYALNSYHIFSIYSPILMKFSYNYSAKVFVKFDI